MTETALLHTDTRRPRETLGGTLLRFRDQAPVDVQGLALALGARVWHSPELPADISARIVRDPVRGRDAGFAIIVNGNEGRRRRRFTIAHEIAHLVLHRDLIGDGITEDNMYCSGLASEYETQANWLAADILMPPNLIRDLFTQETNDPAALAARFDVSTEAMEIRLGQLGFAAPTPAFAAAVPAEAVAGA